MYNRDSHVGVVGLGRMGDAVAARLAGELRGVTAWNRTPQPPDPTVGFSQVPRLPDLMQGNDVVLSCLADDAAVLEVFSLSFCQSLRPGSIVIEMFIVVPSTMVELRRRLGDRGTQLVDAPLFGRPNEARRGELVIPFSGPPLSGLGRRCLEVLGVNLIDCGPTAGTVLEVKLAGNSVAIGLIGLLGEDMHQVARTGVDPAKFVRVLQNVDFASPVLLGRAHAMAAGDYPSGFAIKSVVKNMRLIRQARGESGRLLAAILSLYEDALASLGSDSDFAEVSRHLNADIGARRG